MELSNNIHSKLQPVMKNIFLLFSFMFTASLATFAQERETFPLAEWDYAKAILMHTPGE
jgi:hypothetical protein